jgi:predicted ATPase with chaperone activity
MQPAVRRGYLGRLSGPLLDAVDLKVWMEVPSRQGLLQDQRWAERSAAVAERVATACERAYAPSR